MNSPAAIKRAVLLTAMCFVILPLQACAWTALLFGPSNGVRSVDLAELAPETKKTVIVVGLRAATTSPSRGATVVLSRFDPATKSAGDCGTYHHAKIVLPPTTEGPRYAAFEVPSGTWVFNYHSYTSEDAVPNTYKGTFPAFIVPAGKTTYIGEFVLTSDYSYEAPGSKRGTYRLERDLIGARQVLGPGVNQMELAETTPDPDYRPIFCML